MDAKKVLEDLKRRFPNEPEYHQAVEEVLSTIEEEYNKHPEFEKANLIERLCIPDRVYQFRVTWMDDKGQIQTNMGYPFPQFRKPQHFEVPGFRADFQKLSDHSSYGRWQGRFRFLSARQEQRRGDAFLPGFHARTQSPYRSRYRCAGR